MVDVRSSARSRAATVLTPSNLWTSPPTRNRNLGNTSFLNLASWPGCPMSKAWSRCGRALVDVLGHLRPADDICPTPARAPDHFAQPGLPPFGGWPVFLRLRGNRTVAAPRRPPQGGANDGPEGCA